MLFKLYSILLDKGEISYGFEFDSCITNSHYNSISALLSSIQKYNIKSIPHIKNKYAYAHFLSYSNVISITFIAEHEFTDFNDLLINLESILHTKYPELFL